MHILHIMDNVLFYYTYVVSPYQSKVPAFFLKYSEKPLLYFLRKVHSYRRAIGDPFYSFLYNKCIEIHIRELGTLVHTCPFWLWHLSALMFW